MQALKYVPSSQCVYHLSVRLSQRALRPHSAHSLHAFLSCSGVVTELRAQLKVSAEGHELLRSHSGSIEQLRGQVELKKNASRELERQACIVSELKDQVRSCESSWRLEMSQQVGMTQPSACLGNSVDRLSLESLCQRQGILSFCLSDQLCKLMNAPVGLWPMVIAPSCRLERLPF